MEIYGLPALKSNYFWLVQPDPDSKRAYVFDPGDHRPVIDALERQGLTLAGVIITHHHWDHTDGIDPLLEQYPVPVFGPRSERISQVTHVLSDGDCLNIDGVQFDVMATPGHTLDHIAYYDPDSKALFSADNIFSVGCGRLFEGTPEQFLATLTRLSRLPPDTLIYASHEYTLANIDFALAVEPDNDALRRRQREAQSLRDEGKATVPTLLSKELQTNPFLRTDQPSVIESAIKRTGQSELTQAEVFACLRNWKDNF